MNPQYVIYIQATAKNLTISSKGINATPIMPAPGLDENLKIVNSNIFVKTEGDAFKTEGLDHFLADCKARKIILTGMLIEKCVYKTALGGLKKGYEVYIVPEAVIGQTTESKKKALEKLVKKGAIIIQTGETDKIL
jgi:nicotinamidase-related amidase